MRIAIVAFLAVACKSPEPPVGGFQACVGPPATSAVDLVASDGRAVHGTFTSPCRGAPIVVLVHDLCRDRTEWQTPPHDWARAFADGAIATLAIDLRGHGASAEGGPDLCASLRDPVAQPLYAGTALDVEAATAWAEARAPAVGLVGAGLGADAALVAFGADPRVAAIVAISPAVDDRGLDVRAALAAAGRRPAALVAAADDEKSAADVRALASLPNVDAEVVPTGAHGNNVIDANPGLLAALVAKLSRALGRTR